MSKMIFDGLFMGCQCALGAVRGSLFECFKTTLLVQMKVRANGLDISTGQCVNLSGFQSFGFEVNVATPFISKPRRRVHVVSAESPTGVY